MKTLVLLTLTAGALAGCQQDNRNIDKKLDTVLARLDRLESRIGQGGAAGGGGQRAPRPEPDRSKTYAVPVEGDPFDGPADAKVTLVKAYDYACPFCERVRPSMDELHKKYGNDLRIVYKQLVVHPRNAMAGALAFCAAAKQGKHREMDAMVWDKGFKVKQMDNSDVPVGGQPEQAPGQPPAAPAGGTQKCWDTPAGCTNVVGYATELGLDIERFKADMRGDCMKLVQKDMGDMQRLGVSATPAFFVNGRYLSGAMPTEQFAALIDDELKKANERIAAGTPAAQYYQQWVIDKGLKSLSGN